MTRTEFYRGIKFHWMKGSKIKSFEFVFDKSDNSIGYIKERGLFHCVVKKATRNYVYYYTSVMGKPVKGKIAYSELFSENDK